MFQEGIEQFLSIYKQTVFVGILQLSCDNKTQNDRKFHDGVQILATEIPQRQSYEMFTKERSLVMGWAGMMGIFVMCYLLE